MMSSDEVLIHVRFSPDGAVTDIGERPAATPPQNWFNQLAAKFGEVYQPLSGGRGLFRVARSDVDSFKTSLASA
jgi:hypothetical protein